MTTLVVPGVRVEARFDVLPPLPVPAGILGAVGIVDRPPQGGGLVGVTKVTELRQLLGPGTEASMPEVVHALANGVSEAVVAPVAGGSPASCSLLNVDSNSVVLLRCRSNGEWGNALQAEVRGIADAIGSIVRVELRILSSGKLVESFSDLQVAPGQPDDLFDTINQFSRYVVALDPGFAGSTPTEGTYAFNSDGDPLAVLVSEGTDTLFQLLPSDEVADPTGLSVQIDVGTGDEIQVRVFQGGLQEEFPDLVMNPDSAQYLPYVLLTQSRLVRVLLMSSEADSTKRLPVATDAPQPFISGTSPTVAQYREAIDLLADDPRVDLLIASIEPGRSNDDVKQIHQALVAHAVTLADNGAPRIAFGSVTADEQSDLAKIKDHAAAVRNRRFVLVSPPSAEGAVAGVVGRMNPQDSPTFKPVPLFGIAPATYRESELNRLLGPSTNLLVVQDRAGRGVVGLKGIDTTGDQISVTRVADQAIRETKAISENFIGRLNTEDARIALKQQIVATFTRMERAGALVPSTDGTDPAFLVDVYSTQQDFAQGIVRIDIAVRPVRAIDYIYATIRVKN
ncbi:MAG: phage tail sheath C-terminal domain-containing protein [Anaerolineae bacterium]